MLAVQIGNRHSKQGAKPTAATRPAAKHIFCMACSQSVHWDSHLERSSFKLCREAI